MPPKAAAKAAAAAGGTPRPTVQEAHLLYAVIQNAKGQNEIDWDGVAADTGFKNAGTAKVGRLYFNSNPSSGPYGGAS